MPGSVVLATPTTVFPNSLSSAYQRVKTFEQIVNVYPDATNQRSALVQSDRSTWALTKRLNPTQMAALRAFYNARNGPWAAFFFYDVFESNFQYDASGTQTLGRYIARFQGGLQIAGAYPRVNTQLTIIQID